MYQENPITKIKLKLRKKTLNINGSKYIINSKFTVLELINYLTDDFLPDYLKKK